MFHLEPTPISLKVIELIKKIIYLKVFILPRVAEFIYIEGDNKRVCLVLKS